MSLCILRSKIFFHFPAGLGALWAILLGLASSAVSAERVSKISQYGVTWTLDREYPAGQFITGDWWVVGPVKVVSVDPAPAAAPKGAAATGQVKSRYGATAMVEDDRMRNGSMIVTEAASSQGYDSRMKNFDPKTSVKYPLTLPVDRSLISTISNETFPAPVMHEAIMWQAYRDKVPDQPGGGSPTKWVWNSGGQTGKYVPNSK